MHELQEKVIRMEEQMRHMFEALQTFFCVQ